MSTTTTATRTSKICIFGDDVLVLSWTTQMRWFQFNSRIVRSHFASVMTLNNREMIGERRSYVFA